MVLDIISTSITIIMLIIATVIDRKTRKIPNWLTFPCIIGGTVISFFSSVNCGITAIISLIVLFILGMTGFLGIGDLKLIMAVTALQGPIAGFISLVIAACLLVYTHVIKQKNVVNMKRLIDKDLVCEGIKVPFAQYILLGYAIFFFLTKF